MKKKAIMSLLVMGVFLTCTAQDDSDLKTKASEGLQLKQIENDSWLRGGFISCNLSATTFSGSWVSGGTNNIAFLSNINLFAIRKHGDGIWENYFESVYGLIRSGEAKISSGPDSGSTNPFVKNEDRLVFTSKYGRKISPKLNYAALFNLNTQLFQGYASDDPLQKQPHLSNFMAQGFGYLSIGFDYKPEPYLSVYFSPVTAKYTIVREQRLADMGAFGVRQAEYDTLGQLVRKGERFRTELGWYTNFFYKKDIKKSLSIQSRLELFNNYADLGNIDVNWQNTINYKIGKLFSISWINQVLYDDDMDTDPEKEGKQPRIQWKSFFGIGFSM
jgi:hypothetical protein